MEDPDVICLQEVSAATRVGPLSPEPSAYRAHVRQACPSGSAECTRRVLVMQTKLQDQHCADVEARLRLPEGWSVTFNCSQARPANAAAADSMLGLLSLSSALE